MPLRKVWLGGQIKMLQLLCCVTIGLSTRCLAAEPGITIRLDPTETADWRSTAVWYAYMLVRVKFREDHKLPAPKYGTVSPTFDEEVYARAGAAQIYTKLKHENKDWHNAYWESLLEVEAKGFMNAYIWTYFHQDSWPASARPENLSVFQTWNRLHLKNHQALTYGALVVGQEKH